jgi:hypothetical protein
MARAHFRSLTKKLTSNGRNHLKGEKKNPRKKIQKNLQPGRRGRDPSLKNAPKKFQLLPKRHTEIYFFF